jgi:hypothetical protein
MVPKLFCWLLNHDRVKKIVLNQKPIDAAVSAPADDDDVVFICKILAPPPRSSVIMMAPGPSIVIPKAGVTLVMGGLGEVSVAVSLSVMVDPVVEVVPAAVVAAAVDYRTPGLCPADLVKARRVKRMQPFKREHREIEYYWQAAGGTARWGPELVPQHAIAGPSRGSHYHPAEKVFKISRKARKRDFDDQYRRRSPQTPQKRPK